MNFLAHAYLSPSCELTMLGNTFGDLVKGWKMEGVHPLVRKGVFLHRSIDDFTDCHLIVKQCVEVFKPSLARFAPVVVDMVFDYYLAKKWHEYSELPLEEFIADLFRKYHKNQILLTPRMNEVVPIMIEQNWIIKYRSLGGLEVILRQMSARLKNRVQLHQAIPVLKKNEKELEGHFELFFKELETHFTT